MADSLHRGISVVFIGSSDCECLNLRVSTRLGSSLAEEGSIDCWRNVALLLKNYTDYKTNAQIAKELKITPILDKLLEYKRN